MIDTQEIVRSHLRHFFAGHSYVEDRWTLGPMATLIPRFRVACLSPGPKSDLWIYATVGACDIRRGDAGILEFFIAAPERDRRQVEMVTMIAHYHRDQALGVGHTLPIGEPWIEGSSCDHLLVSTPYPFGPGLEICPIGEDHAHFLWLLPITATERTFKIANGLEALEQRFDDCGLIYWNPFRESAI